jgi:hypothetical protein
MPKLRQETAQLYMNGLVDPAFLVYLAGDEAAPACRGKPVELFFPEQGGSSRPAKDICARCRERVACKAWALRQNTYLMGIWGGTSWSDRLRR